MSGNGVQTTGLVTIKAHPVMGVYGYLAMNHRIGCCVVVRGSTSVISAVLPIATTTIPATVTTISVFEWFARPEDFKYRSPLFPSFPFVSAANKKIFVSNFF